MAQKPIAKHHRDIAKCPNSTEQRIGKNWIYRCGVMPYAYRGSIPCTPKDWKICPSNDKRD